MDIARLDLPDLHARMLERVVAVVRDDERFEALLGTGSLAYGGFDEHSDIDFVIVVRTDDHVAAMAKALVAPTLPGTGHRSIAGALKRSAALYVELRGAEPPASPVKGVPGLLLDFIDGKQPRA